MSPREHDPELRDLISAGDSLHEQLARLDRSEPPEELDRIVIERARQAIRMPQSERPIRQLRWAVPLALAATLLISFALVVHQVEPQQPRVAPPVAATSERSTDSYPPVAAQARVDEAEKPASTSSPVAAVSKTAAPQRSTEAAAAASVASRAAETAESVARTRVTPDVALAKREEYAADNVTVTAATEGNAVAPASEPSAEARADSAQRAGALAGRAKGEAKADFRADPDAWIAYIARLREQGRSEEAAREYGEFRLAFPGYKYVAPAGPSPGDIAPDR